MDRHGIWLNEQALLLLWNVDTYVFMRIKTGICIWHACSDRFTWVLVKYPLFNFFLSLHQTWRELQQFIHECFPPVFRMFNLDGWTGQNWHFTLQLSLESASMSSNNISHWRRHLIFTLFCWLLQPFFSHKILFNQPKSAGFSTSRIEWFLTAESQTYDKLCIGLATSASCADSSC